MTEDVSIRHWWLIRHAPVKTDKIYGQMDVVADFSDAMRLERLARQLPEKAAVISSDLGRCRETARRLLAITEGPDMPVALRKDLREQSFGRWEGRTYEDIARNDPEAYAEFWRDPAAACPDGGESFTELANRVEAALLEVARQSGERHIVIVAHGGTIRAAIGHALGLQPRQMLALAVAPLSLSRLTSFHGEEGITWRIDSINEQGTEV